MTTEQLISDITSGDVSRIRTAACKIISFSQEKEKILLFKNFRQLIIDKTAGLEMGGAFAPNKRFVEYAIKIIDFHVSDQRCPCSLYSDFGYECNDPKEEAEKRTIKIEGLVKIENTWIDYYFCTCLKCGQKFKALERDGHYTWWAWTKINEFTAVPAPILPEQTRQINDTETIHKAEKMIPIEIQKKGYYDLIELCVGEPKKAELIKFIDTLRDYNGDEDFYTTLNYVKDHLDNKGIHFIMGLDWKQEIRDLNWRINSSLNDNFNTKIDLPDFMSYGERASVSSKNVFKDFDQSLRTQNYKIGFIDTESDEFVILIHKIKDGNEIIEAVKKIGYNYLDVSSPKINNEN